MILMSSCLELEVSLKTYLMIGSMLRRTSWRSVSFTHQAMTLSFITRLSKTSSSRLVVFMKLLVLLSYWLIMICWPILVWQSNTQFMEGNYNYILYCTVPTYANVCKQSLMKLSLQRTVLLSFWLINFIPWKRRFSALSIFPFISYKWRLLFQIVI